jgi:hypothetical protein
MNFILFDKENHFENIQILKFEKLFNYFNLLVNSIVNNKLVHVFCQ